MVTFDDYNAITIKLDIQTAAAGPLKNMTFAVKENIDVYEIVSTNGHPLWAQTHQKALAHAEVVDRLLQAGAHLIGKTHMDEMAYSLLGANAHFGAPINPTLPDRLPGGSSSGSAVTVAAGITDFAVGTDTGGSCRAPASFCGVFGLRPSHQSINMRGVIPMSRSLDVIGWFTRDIDHLITIAKVLLPEDKTQVRYEEAVFLSESLEDADPEFKEMAQSALMRLKCGPWRMASLGEDFFAQALMHFRNLQGYEVWSEHQSWILTHQPNFGPGVSERLKIAATVTKAEKLAAEQFIATYRSAIDALFGDAGAIIMPTTPGLAPKIDESLEALDRLRYAMLKFFLIASLFGLPQISIPIKKRHCAIGLSFIGQRGSDHQLLSFAKNFCAQNNILSKEQQSSHPQIERPFFHKSPG